MRPHLHSLHHLRDSPAAQCVLTEEVFSSQVRAPHVVNAHGGVQLVQQLVQHVLIGGARVLRVNSRSHGLQHAEKHFLSSSRQLQRK